MVIVFRHRGRDQELEVIAHDPDATVGDLRHALETGDGLVEGLAVDGAHVAADRRLDRAAIREGSVVELPRADRPARDPDRPEGGVELRVVGGLAAGARHPLVPGRWTLGRSGADIELSGPTVSARHAILEVGSDGTVVLADGGSRNGTWLGCRAVDRAALGRGEVARLGAVLVALADGAADDRPAAATRTPGPTVAFNRPPRPAPPPDPEPIDPPRPPDAAPATSPLGIVAVLAPLVVGAVMVEVFGSLLYGLFALLSPVVAIGSAIESRRRRAKGARRERQRFATDLDRFRAALTERATVARARLEAIGPDPAEVVRRATQPSTHLWERRPGHHDHLCLRLGTAPVPWPAPIRGEARDLDRPTRHALDAATTLAGAPLVVDLSGGAVLGLVGDRAAALAVARSLVVQAATHHGPADLPVVVLASPSHGPDWTWAAWLPHGSDPDRTDRRRVVADPDAADALVRSLLEQRSGADPGPSPTLLVVIDDEELTAGRRSPARSVLRGLAGPVAGIVVATTEDRLPAVCTRVLELRGPDGLATFHRVDLGDRIDDVLAAGIDEPTARRSARALARWEDPEQAAPGRGLPATVGLVPLLGRTAIDGPGLQARWEAGRAEGGLTAPIGVAGDGILAVDLVRDGPHALVAGTTGSGKSELLRTWVAALAATHSPDDLTFVLVDFKGGSAFDRCAGLPHVVGLVTDLDAHLAGRALRCLEAELRHRERRLRSAAVADILAFHRLPPDRDREPLPRLALVIDEFATLKAEVPDFVEALVGIAQRGRSLGVHLVLATQRPSGAVSEHIRANTNLRIALRVQDEADSTDVIDRPDAAHIGRHQPGRALARLGPGEVITLQTALATGSATTCGSAPVEVRPFALHATATAATNDAAAHEGDHQQGDLGRLVEAAVAAHRSAGGRPPRRPWPDPLPPAVDLATMLGPGRAPFGRPGAVVEVALADDPDRQRQHPTGWDPSAGNLLLLGIPGSGITTACTSLVLTIAGNDPPDRVHLHLLDLGAGRLDELALLPHVGSVVLAGQRERQARLARWFRAELARRRGLPAARTSEPRLVLVIDGLAGLRAEWEDAFLGVVEDLQAVYADGPEVGIHCVVTADRTGAVPAALQAVTRQRWAFHLADAHEYAAIGLPSHGLGDLGPGGAIVSGTRQEVRVARAADVAASVAEIRARWAARAGPRPSSIGALAGAVPVAEIAGAARLGPTSWFLPVGIGDDDLAPAGFVLHDGEHALVAGPSRSGRSATLCTLAEVVRDRAWSVHVLAVAEPRSPLWCNPAVDRSVLPDDLAALASTVDGTVGPVLLLVDDADLIADADGTLASLLARRRPDLHVVAAGRSETLRTAYGHWTRTVRLSRTALLLQPDTDLDGDLVGTTLPRRSVSPLPQGRGYLVGGGSPGLELVQVATPAAGFAMERHEEQQNSVNTPPAPQTVRRPHQELPCPESSPPPRPTRP